MSGNFYDVLGVKPDASSDDIRRAYKKKALQTHPDRLPGATPAEKRAAEEQFRKVNNAYEILMDEKNRKRYDMHGVWPPPEELAEEPRWERGRHAGHRRPQHPFPASDPFEDPFFNSPFGDPYSRHHPSHVFRDPFELFNTLFANSQHDFFNAPPPMFRHNPFDPFGPSSVFGPSHPLHRTSPFDHPVSLFPAFPSFPDFPGDHRDSASRPNAPQTFSYRQSSRGHAVPATDGQRTKWVSESRTVRIINGTKESVWKKVDQHGNVHVTYTYPDGSERFTVNGIDQSHPTAHIQDARRAPLSETDSQYSSPPIIPPDQGEGSSRKHWWRRH